MENKDFDEKEYIGKCQIIPGWVHTKEDGLKYAAHLAHRMYQARDQVKIFADKLYETNKEAYKQASALADDSYALKDEVFFNHPYVGFKMTCIDHSIKDV